MSDDFARVYEETAHRITVPVSWAALDLVGSIGPGSRVLDIGAGAGALSISAAERGAAVTAIDVAPGMVRRLASKLAGFRGCEAHLGDGEALVLPEAEYDATFSIFGVVTFSDWRRGLVEQYRMTRPNGKGCVATWREPPGGGPFLIMLAALRAVFPDRPVPPKPQGFLTLSDPQLLQEEMTAAGFGEVTVQQMEFVWEGPSGQAYVDELHELHQYIRPYATLDHEEKTKVDAAIRALTTEAGTDGRLRLQSPVLLAVGARI